MVQNGILRAAEASLRTADWESGAAATRTVLSGTTLVQTPVRPQDAVRDVNRHSDVKLLLLQQRRVGGDASTGVRGRVCWQHVARRVNERLNAELISGAGRHEESRVV